MQRSRGIVTAHRDYLHHKSDTTFFLFFFFKKRSISKIPWFRLEKRYLKATGAESKTALSPPHLSLAEFMVQFQKWRAEIYVRACQQLLLIDSLCKSEAYKWLGRGTRRYPPARDTNSCARRRRFTTRQLLVGQTRWF